MKTKLYLLTVVVLLLLSVGWTNYGQKQKPARETWEYMIVRANDTSGAESTLNTLGAQGWELVSITEVGFAGQGGSVTYYLKRPK